MLRPAATALAAAVLVSGCGNQITRPPDTSTPDPPAGTRVVKLPAAGLTFTAPFNWPDLQSREAAMVAGIQNKRATVAIWRYDRPEPLPETREALEEVKGLLVDRVKARDPAFALDRATYPRRGGARAIELVGRETIAGLPFRVRSSHVFDRGAEIVIDAYAPPEHFERVDSTVFVPLLKSLKLSKPRAPKAATPTPTPMPTAAP